jgi:hypothetical protein
MINVAAYNVEHQRDGVSKYGLATYVREGMVKNLQTCEDLKFRLYTFLLSLTLIFYDGRCRATKRGYANSAIIAFLPIDSANLVTFAFNDGSLGTFIDATTAPDTILRDTISHDTSPEQLRPILAAGFGPC